MPLEAFLRPVLLPTSLLGCRLVRNLFRDGNLGEPNCSLPAIDKTHWYWMQVAVELAVPVKLVVELLLFEKEPPVPLTIDHVPMPVVGVLAVKLVVVALQDNS